MKEILISVIIPIYNTQAYLRKCLDSIINQTYSNLEIILVNDGSTDGSAQICSDYSNKDSRIILINKENKGQGLARNDGIAVARGDYISFIDSDDWVDPEWYERFVSIISKYDADIVRFNYSKNVDGTNEKLHEIKFDGWADIEKFRREILLDTMGSQPCKNICKSHLFENPVFPNHIYEDIIGIYKITERAKSIYFCTDSYYYYRINSTSTSYKPNPKRAYYVFIGFLEKYNYVSENKKYNDIKQALLEKTIIHALQAYNECIRYHAIDKNQEQIVVNSINENYKNLLKTSSNVKLKVLLVLFSRFNGIYKLLAKVHSPVSNRR